MAFLVCLLFRESIGVAITKSFVIFVRKFLVSSNNLSPTMGVMNKMASVTCEFLLSSSQPLKEDKFVIPKSRYDTIDCFLASAEYNDMDVLYDKDIFKQLKDGGG